MECRELGKLCNKVMSETLNLHRPYITQATRYFIYSVEKRDTLFMHMYSITSFISDAPILFAKIVCPPRRFYHYPSISMRQIESRISKNIRQSDCPYTARQSTISKDLRQFIYTSNPWRLQDCYLKYRVRCLTMQ